MTKTMDLSIIIPAYNEEKKIQTDIIEAIKFLKKASLKGEIIVSTDGITDKTNEIVEKMQMNFKNVILLAEKKKIGKGAAIKKGVKISTGNIIMFVDAGLCVPYENAKKGIDLINVGYDCAMGSRAEKGSKILKKQPLYRFIGSKVFKFMIHSLLQIPSQIKDTQCGFKLYKNNVAKDIYSKLKTTKMMFDIEVILRMKKKKYKVASFPVTWKNDEDTKFDPMKGTLDNFHDLFLIKIKHKL